MIWVPFQSRWIYPTYNNTQSRELLCQKHTAYDMHMHTYKIKAVCTGHWAIEKHAAMHAYPTIAEAEKKKKKCLRTSFAIAQLATETR